MADTHQNTQEAFSTCDAILQVVVLEEFYYQGECNQGLKFYILVDLTLDYRQHHLDGPVCVREIELFHLLDELVQHADRSLCLLGLIGVYFCLLVLAVISQNSLKNAVLDVLLDDALNYL